MKIIIVHSFLSLFLLSAINGCSKTASGPETMRRTPSSIINLEPAKNPVEKCQESLQPGTC